MADTTTANIGLLIADLNDTFNFGAHVEVNFTTIDGLMGAVQCTSASRPSNTYAGQIIYETDSKRYAQNTGSKATPAWTYMSHQAYAAASSARPTVGLTAGQLLYETDNLAVRSRGAAAWNGFLAVATSTALPANPIAGDFAYLSDKDAVVRYTGSAWKLTSIVVCTAATRPTLSIAAGTAIYETDTTRLLVYNGTSWEQKAFGMFVCTSSTHPASPFQGLEIYETDTGLSAVYTGSTYYYPPQKIATSTVVGSSTGTVTFNNIPQVFNDLRVIISAKTQAAAAIDIVHFTINNITSANYTYLFQSVTNAGAPANQSASAQTSSICGLAWGSSPATNGCGNSDVTFPSYSRTNFSKGCNWSTHANDGNSTSWEAASGGGMLNASTLTGAITRLDFVSGAANYTAGSTIDLFGF